MMKKVDLRVYGDKIKKLHKAAIAMRVAFNDFDEFQNKVILNDDFDLIDDWDKLTKYLASKPDLTDKLDEVESIIKDINED